MSRCRWIISAMIAVTVSLGLVSSVEAAKKLVANDIQAKWSSNGPLRTPFHNCVQINEPGDPQAELWDDNYLCFNRPDHGFRYSVTGPIPGMHCEKLDIKGGIWSDNHLCSDNVRFAWFGRKIERGYICIRILERGDPHPRASGQSANAFCIKK